MTVSGNPAPGSDEGGGDPDFTGLSEADQREVAERILRLAESGWRPFWCSEPRCTTGDPHPLRDSHGFVTFVDESAKAGPNGEPVCGYYETAAGEAHAVLDPTKVRADETYVGRVILDPKWSHNHARRDQRLPSWLEPWTLFIMSGRGCVAPWTEIDLADGTTQRIDALTARGESVEVMTPDGPRWTEGAPFLKGEAHMWRVRLSTGRVLTVTDEHRFLAPGGWLRLDHVRVGQPLVPAEPALRESSDPASRDGLSEWREDAQRCWSTELGSGCGCPRCRRRSDLPPPPLSDNGQGFAPSRADAIEPADGSSLAGARPCGPGCTRACQREDLRSRSHCALVEPSRAVARSRIAPSPAGSSPPKPPTAATSLASTIPVSPTLVGLLQEAGQAGVQQFASALQRLAGASGLSVSSTPSPQPGSSLSLPLGSEQSDLVWVESIEYSHFGPYFDMSVPGPESYHSEGVVNHNTGKTRTGVEFVTLSARKGLDGAILGRRGTELVNTHVAALIEHAHPDFMPIHYPSKDILVWPNKAITYLFSAEKPENIRSVNLSYAWVDEAAFMDFIGTAWMNLKLATRIEKAGNPIHFLITSTPTSTPWVMEMEDNPEVEVRRVSTYANRANLSASFIRDLEKDYEGTRMGRQELHGEVLRDVVGALWNDDIFKHMKVDDPLDFINLCESMDDVVVAVDPAGSANKRSDLTGIIAVGVQHTDENDDRLEASLFYVLADGTLKGSPTEWARAVFATARATHARRIVAEYNYGGDMVKQVLTDFAKIHPDEAVDHNGEDYNITVVKAQQSKETRAEGTVGKYEQGRVTHVPNCTAFGDMAPLEKEQTLWVPKSRGGKSPSPNRIDALVWAVRALENAVKFAGSMSTMKDLPSAFSPRPVMPRNAPPVIPEAKPVQVGDPTRFETKEPKRWPSKRPPGVRKAG